MTHTGGPGGSEWVVGGPARAETSPRAPQPPRPGPDGPVVLRPSRKQFLSSLRGTPVGLVVLALFLVLQLGTEGLVLALVLSAIAAGGMMLFLTRARIEIGRVHVTSTGLLRTRTHSLGDIGEVLLYPLRPGGVESRTFLTTQVRDRAGRTMLRIRSDVWAPDDVVALAHGLGVRPEVVAEPVGAAEVERVFPGSTPWVHRHPVVAGVLISAGVMAAVAVLVVVWAGLES